ncbi:unnamed protein product, partial [Musa textilis]
GIKKKNNQVKWNHRNKEKAYCEHNNNSNIRWISIYTNDVVCRGLMQSLTQDCNELLQLITI